MAEQKDPPAPHGDKLAPLVGNPRNDPEENQAQVQSDASPDVIGSMPTANEDDGESGAREESDRDRGRGSTANGVPAFDEDDGERRKRLYEKGAVIVSRID